MVDTEHDVAIDYAVAKAMGLSKVVIADKVFIVPREWDELRGICHPTCEGDLACIWFRPSTDLNDAFAAAEVVGLFSAEEGHCYLSFLSETGWMVEHVDAVYDPGNPDRFYVVSPAPALAICAAILKLKES